MKITGFNKYLVSTINLVHKIFTSHYQLQLRFANKLIIYIYEIGMVIFCLMKHSSSDANAIKELKQVKYQKKLQKINYVLHFKSYIKYFLQEEQIMFLCRHLKYLLSMVIWSCNCLIDIHCFISYNNKRCTGGSKHKFTKFTLHVSYTKSSNSSSQKKSNEIKSGNIGGLQI